MRNELDEAKQIIGSLLRVDEPHKYVGLRKQAINFLEREPKVSQWAPLINQLACIIIAGNISSNDLDIANDAIEEVLPYLDG